MPETTITATLPAWEESHLAVICGVANAGGGTIVVNTADKHGRIKPHRFRKPFETIPARSMVELGVACTTEPMMNGMDLCLEITVPAAEEPVSYKGNYYIYSEGFNHLISGEEVERLYDKNATTVWESRLQPFVREEDLDRDILSLVTARLEADIGKRAASEKPIRQFLHRYGMKSIQSNTFTNIGVLLLHRFPEQFIPGALIQLGLFDSNGTMQELSEYITGPLSKQLIKTMDALYTRYIPAALELGAEKEKGAGKLLKTSSFPREAILPPREAVEEALLNALVHKDYESEMPIKVSVYPQQIYIDNVGRPPESWTLKDLLGRHNSRPHNPGLALTLQDQHVFNGWGRGVSMMVKSCSEVGLPAPEFNLRADEMSVMFTFGTTTKKTILSRGAGKASRLSSRSATQLAAQPPAQLATHQSPLTSSPPSSSSQTATSTEAAEQAQKRHRTFKERSIAAANRLDMTSTDEYILKVLETNGRVTAMRIAEVLGVSESTVRRSFRRLKEYEFIERIGSDKAGYWRLVD